MSSDRDDSTHPRLHGQVAEDPSRPRHGTWRHLLAKFGEPAWISPGNSLRLQNRQQQAADHRFPAGGIHELPLPGDCKLA